MTEEIMQSIIAAEQQAAVIKNAATEKAATMQADSEKQAVRLEQTAVEVCKAYRDSQLKQAVADAETAYSDTLVQKTEEAKNYCARVLENSDAAVSKIVGRILSGNC